ncbi:tetratricopeptide repeat protein [Myroides fluvii]|uniref:tetratricopeptide repeat protein n=1 Tax=Myroides fluvii TaxID=2572594 RepID=UPI00131B454E|nr:hypothetical protein [Myroides fluvii]
MKIGYTIRLAALYARESDALNDKSTSLYNQAIQWVEHDSDLAFQTWVYSKTGFYYYIYNQYTEAYPYFTKSAQALNQLSNADLFRGNEVLKENAYFFQTITEYDTSIDFLTRALNIIPKNSKEYPTLLNALGANYFNKKDFITAEKYFIRTKESAITAQDSIRYAKAIGDLARIEITRSNWKKAEQLLLEDIAISARIGEFRNEMYAQLQLSKMYFKQGLLAEAKQTLLEVKTYADSKSYLKIYAKESTDLLLQIAIVQKNEQEELTLRRELDRLNLQVKTEDKSIIDKVALNYQKKNIEWELSLQQIKLEQVQVLQRTWFFISFLLSIIVILIYILYKRRIKLNDVKFQNKLLGFQNDKMQMEAKLTDAHNSLDSFYTYLDSKNDQVKQLEREISLIKNKEQKISLEALLTSHLMTDDNWAFFKQAFREEQTTYYQQLLTRFPNLTESNLRIILLQKLGLNNQEMAQIIGITPDAVKKAKQRLRKKYSKNEEDIFEFSLFLGDD